MVGRVVRVVLDGVMGVKMRSGRRRSGAQGRPRLRSRLGFGVHGLGPGIQGCQAGRRSGVGGRVRFPVAPVVLKRKGKGKGVECAASVEGRRVRRREMVVGRCMLDVLHRFGDWSSGGFWLRAEAGDRWASLILYWGRDQRRMGMFGLLNPNTILW